jgi:hypothetical protein
MAPTDGSSWVYRENRVPDYQKKFQQHDGVRLWEKVRAVSLAGPERKSCECRGENDTTGLMR